LSLNKVYISSRFCPSLLEIVSLRELISYIREFTYSMSAFQVRIFLLLSCSSAAIVICWNAHVFKMFLSVKFYNTHGTLFIMYLINLYDNFDLP
jgi:hypothetical protein